MLSDIPSSSVSAAASLGTGRTKINKATIVNAIVITREYAREHDVSNIATVIGVQACELVIVVLDMSYGILLHNRVRNYTSKRCQSLRVRIGTQKLGMVW